MIINRFFMSINVKNESPNKTVIEVFEDADYCVFDESYFLIDEIVCSVYEM